MSAFVSSSLIGQMLGHYRVIEQLGAGGMGVVYKAQDLNLGRYVALKLLAATATTAEAVDRFRREARTASSLNHPNICTIYGFFEHEGQFVLAMELLEGDALEKRIEGKALDIRTAIDIGVQVTDALDAAHAEGILHRDIKPANIFLTKRNQVKVLDFGLAKLAAGRSDAATNVSNLFTSVAGTTAGTIAYMSPEQARGEELDSRTDLFSFGVVLYEMATGKQSFVGSTTAIVFDGILNREPVAVRALNANVPPELERIIFKALEKDRTLRYQTAADMRADLQRLRRDSSTRSGPNLPIASADSAVTVIVPPPQGAAPSAAYQSGSLPPPAATPASAAPVSSVSVDPLASRPAATPDSTAAAPPATVEAPPMKPAASGAPTVPKKRLSTAAMVLIAVGSLGALLLIATTVVAVRWMSGNQGKLAEQATQEAAAPTTTALTTTVPANATAAAPAPPPLPAPPSSANTAPPAPGTPKPPAVAATRPSRNQTPQAAASADGRGAAKPVEAPAPPAPPPPPTPAPPSPDTLAAQHLEAAQAKIASNAIEPALADLRQIVNDYPNTPAAAEAAFLQGTLLEKAGRSDEAMAAHSAFLKRYANDRRAAESKLRLADLTMRSRLPNREIAGRELLNQVVREHPGSPQALQALQSKIRLENDRRKFREVDPVIGAQVPSLLVSLRTLTEQFPTAAPSMSALDRLAELYEDVNQYERAAQTLTDLATRFPSASDAWFRLGELYERRLRDPAKARDAYAKVPPESRRYRDAQNKLNRR